ncbi:MAG TPA: helix-turn-helix domain-containing protein [Candidatus Nanoarchaeia archaeon]|nr:helix-turn-helix domain-containing protein [Candidatus Nanoarchaeia archaeon]
MWVCKFRFKDDSCPFSTRTEKFQVHCYQYPLRALKSKRGWCYISSNILFGDDIKKKLFLEDMRRDAAINNFEVDGNFFVASVCGRDEPWIQDFYNQTILFPKPVINAPDGFEYWEIASFDKESVLKVFRLAEKNLGASLLQVHESGPASLCIPRVMPELTDKQWHAFDIATKQGYYNFPRSVNLEDLSRLCQVSRPTYEEHLRKAEGKIINFMGELFK